MENSQKTESIKDLVDKLDQGKIVLPEFQRDFVWEISKTYELFGLRPYNRDDLIRI